LHEKRPTVEMIDQLALFLILACIAEIAGTLTGFGSSILFVPLATLFFDFQTVLGITAVFHVMSNVVKILLFWRGVEWKIVVQLGIPAVLFVSLGAYMTQWWSPEFLTLVMNISLGTLAFLLYRFPTFRWPTTPFYLGLSGVISGGLAGLTGSGGAVRGLALAALHLSKHAYISTSAWIDLGVDLSRALIYTQQGYFKSEHLVYLPGLLVASVLGSWLGKKGLNFISENVFRGLVLAAVTLSAAIQIYTYFSAR